MPGEDDESAGKPVDQNSDASFSKAFKIPPKRQRISSDACIAGLGLNLAAAARHFRADHAVNGGRIGVMLALAAVVDFCDQAGMAKEQRDPLFQLFLALQSADDGARSPLLQVTSRAGAPPLTDAERYQRGCIAGAMEAMMRGGATPDAAAKWVAKRAHNMAAAARVKAALWKAVKSWRVTAAGGDPNQDRDTLAYRTACEMFDQGRPVGEQAAETILRLAAVQGTIQETPGLS